MSDVDTAAIRAEHFQSPHGDCHKCGSLYPLPCDAWRLCDALDEARAEIVLMNRDAAVRADERWSWRFRAAKAEYNLAAAQARLAAVRDHHLPLELPGGVLVCQRCDDGFGNAYAYPCPTELSAASPAEPAYTEAQIRAAFAPLLRASGPVHTLPDDLLAALAAGEPQPAVPAGFSANCLVINGVCIAEHDCGNDAPSAGGSGAGAPTPATTCEFEWFGHWGTGLCDKGTCNCEQLPKSCRECGEFEDHPVHGGAPTSPAEPCGSLNPYYRAVRCYIEKGHAGSHEWTTANGTGIAWPQRELERGDDHA